MLFGSLAESNERQKSAESQDYSFDDEASDKKSKELKQEMISTSEED